MKHVWWHQPFLLDTKEVSKTVVVSLYPKLEWPREFLLPGSNCSSACSRLGLDLNCSLGD